MAFYRSKKSSASPIDVYLTLYGNVKKDPYNVNSKTNAVSVIKNNGQTKLKIGKRKRSTSISENDTSIFFAAVVTNEPDGASGSRFVFENLPITEETTLIEYDIPSGYNYVKLQLSGSATNSNDWRVVDAYVWIYLE